MIYIADDDDMKHQNPYEGVNIRVKSLYIQIPPNILLELDGCIMLFLLASWQNVISWVYELQNVIIFFC